MSNQKKFKTHIINAKRELLRLLVMISPDEITEGEDKIAVLLVNDADCQFISNKGKKEKEG